MTKDEITRALRICGNSRKCTECPLRDAESCLHILTTCATDLIEQQAARIAELEAKVPRWIPVEERLPEQDIPVLAWFEDGLISRQSPDIVLWNGHGWMHWHLHRNVCGITHWMPLPGAEV